MTATEDTLVVAEVFGPTFGGEGPSAGRAASFVRLGGCNLTCRFCDTPQTWDAARFNLRDELARTPVEDILSTVERHGTPLVVITGGEPLLHQQQDGWWSLLDGLAAMGRRVEIETNGTLAPTPHTALRAAGFNVSPKLANAGMEETRRIVPAALEALRATGRAVFKFVCRNGDDVDAVAALTADLDIPRHLVWIMPEGFSTEVVTRTAALVAPRAVQYRFNFTHRLHILIWEGERGR